MDRKASCGFISIDCDCDYVDGDSDNIHDAYDNDVDVDILRMYIIYTQQVGGAAQHGQEGQPEEEECPHAQYHGHFLRIGFGHAQPQPYPTPCSIPWTLSEHGCG